MSNELRKRIIQELRDNPGQKAKYIAKELGVDKALVNSLLYGQLRPNVRQNEKYEWFLKEDFVFKEKQKVQSKSPHTYLTKLCKYYLECLSLTDEKGISAYAFDKYGKPDYCELNSIEPELIFSNDYAQKLMGKIRRDRYRLSLYFGYPVVIRKIVSRKSNWEGFLVQPIFLFPLEGVLDNDKQIELSDVPIINAAAIEFCAKPEYGAIMDEIVQIEQELGLVGEGETPDLDDLARRLELIRPDWEWQEKINPDELNTDPPLSEVETAGIYNRAVLIIGERSPYTQGLETELNELSKIPEEIYKDTALGHWVRKTILKVDKEQLDIYEVLPMNEEQKQAVSAALTNYLTVITGPPGTGKSQVVTNILINAAWSGKRVLFASKNNKAVDVVESRINNLGNRPVLLRLGANEYEGKLQEYLTNFLSYKVTQEDKNQYHELNEEYLSLKKRYELLQEEEDETIELRNLVDRLDQEAEYARKHLPTKIFEHINSFSINKVNQEISQFKSQALSCVKKEQPFFVRLFWAFIGAKRYSNLINIARNIQPYASILGILLPIESSIEDINLWVETANDMAEKFSLFISLKTYMDGLEKLKKRRGLFEIACDKYQTKDKISTIALKLWNAWIRIQPSKLTQSQKEALSKYCTILKIKTAGGQIDRKIFREYYCLLPQIMNFLSCWAVTSLSARGRIPLDPGFFDLVVFDEASQCDIASALPLLYRAKRAVIIGDPKQLAHISGIHIKQDMQIFDKHGLSIEEDVLWNYTENSLFGIAQSLVGNNEIINLLNHYRSHDDIIQFSNNFFYDGSLRNETKHEALKTDVGRLGVRWLHVKGNFRRPPTGSAENEIEAREIVRELRELVLERKYPGTIGIVTPFRAQANLIRRYINQDDMLSETLIRHDFLVQTVHKFQGDERDIIFFSPVVTENADARSILFLQNTGNLFNVAITRARAVLMVVGDEKYAAESKVGYLRAFAEYTQELRKKEESTIAQEYEKLGPKYPKVSNPEQVSEWEILLYEAMYQEGLRPLPQYRVDKYILDFALFSGDSKLDIEVDGERYHKNWTGELCRRDQIRNYRMYELGWDVIRFWVYEIRDDMPRCIDRIKRWVSENT